MRQCGTIRYAFRNVTGALCLSGILHPPKAYGKANWLSVESEIPNSKLILIENENRSSPLEVSRWLRGALLIMNEILGAGLSSYLDFQTDQSKLRFQKKYHGSYSAFGSKYFFSYWFGTLRNKYSVADRD